MRSSFEMEWMSLLRTRSAGTSTYVISYWLDGTTNMMKSRSIAVGGTPEWMHGTIRAVSLSKQHRPKASPARRMGCPGRSRWHPPLMSIGRMQSYQVAGFHARGKAVATRTVEGLMCRGLNYTILYIFNYSSFTKSISLTVGFNSESLTILYRKLWVSKSSSGG